MSVPPLVCSTPPPPDHVDEIVYNDEFSLDYEDSSPSHQYESRGYSFNDPPSAKEMSPDNIAPSPYLSSPTEKVNTFQNKKDETNEDEIATKKEEPTAVLEKLSNQADITPQDEYKANDISDHIIEDNGIEDLDLKLDSLQLDFQNAKESIEDTLNSTFDDFGTFLSTNVSNDSLENSIYLPIPGLTENKLEKPQKLQEISSDGSFTPPNGDNSDSEVGWENVPDSLNENTDLDISTEVPDIFFDTNVVYPDADKDLPDNVTNEIQDNTNDTCQTLTDSSISNNDEFSIDTHFEGIEGVPCDKNLENSEHFSEKSHAEITAEILDNNDKNTDPEVSKLSLESLDTLIDEPLQSVDFVSDAFKSFSVPSDEKINIDTHSIVETQNVCTETQEDVKTFADDDFDDFATFDNSDENPFPVNLENESFTFNIDQLKSNERDIVFDGAESVLRNESASQSDNDDFGDFDTYDPTCEPVLSETTEAAETPFVSSSNTETMQMAEFGNSNDTEVYEKMCSVVNEIFPDESFDSDSCEDCELNTALGENWKHLKDYETEQSYLFQWNNSASQKSLLKSLGIDSRNILFGPKWNTNMPRFAANLGVSPLQPIRQVSNMNAMSDYRTDDRTSNDDENPAAISSECKENDWENATSLSTTDLQASSYAESLLLDLEHLMATLDQMTSGQSAHFKISDLFTNAIERGEEHTNIPHSCEHVSPPEQPNKPVKSAVHPTMLNIGRHINLPETHIFTPTDSETPWSHTIHYNDTDKTLTQGSNTSEINSFNTLPKSETLDGIQQDAFEDFSDFKSHSGFGSVPRPSENPHTLDYDFDFSLNEKVHDIALSTDFKDHIPKQILPSVESGAKEIDDFGDFHSAEALKQVSQAPSSIPAAQPLHVLEPVKMIPNVPVVNWPAPGNIKSSAFEEFTDIPAVPPLQPIWDDTQTFPPVKLFSSAPTFILKESKITSECFVGDVPLEIPKLKTNTQSAEFDEFSEFQSVAEASSKKQPLGFGTSYIGQTYNKEHTPISNTDLNKNISFETKSVNAVNDDFDDFQSVEFNSPSTASKDTPKYTYSVQSFPRQEFIPKYQNNFQPSAATKTSSAKPLGYPADQYSRTPLQPVSVQQTDDFTTKNASHQILQPLSLESYSQINWPDPGIDLQDLSRFNPINSIQSYTEPKETKNVNSHGSSQDDDGWSDFVSIKPVSQNVSKTSGFNAVSNNHPSAANASMEDSEDWSDFVSNTVLPSRNYNEVKTISQNIHSQANSAAPYKYKGGGNTNLNPSTPKTPEMPPSVSVLPHLSYSTSKTSVSRKYNNHFQNL